MTDALLAFLCGVLGMVSIAYYSAADNWGHLSPRRRRQFRQIGTVASLLVAMIPLSMMLL